MRKRKLTKKEKFDKAKEYLDNIITQDILIEAEELHKKMNHISVEELYRQFTV